MNREVNVVLVVLAIKKRLQAEWTELLIKRVDLSLQFQAKALIVLR